MRNDSLALNNEKVAQQLTEGLEETSGLSIKRRSWFERTVKRSVDVGVSLLVFVFGFPFFLAIALLIKITSKGSVFFQAEAGRMRRLDLYPVQISHDEARIG